MSFNFVLSPRACELVNHCEFNQYPYRLHSELDYPPGSFYLVGVDFFNFSIDWFAELGSGILADLRQGRIRVLFYYHEGDSPATIKQRLDQLCQRYELPVDCYRFVSGNTAAGSIPGFVYFPDHELLFQRQNHQQAAVDIHTDPRDRDFTALSRTHKNWRATIMADLHRRGLLRNSYWSYRTDVNVDQDASPIFLKFFPGLEEYTQEFLAGSPYVCDVLSPDQHNNHKLTNTEFYNNAYCNIVLETFFDIEQSGGTFVTEKIFKPIKNGQPFVVAGPAGTLQCLRELGYRTFDHAIDNQYDHEEDHSMRWFRLVVAIKQLRDQDWVSWYQSCLADLEHNQQLFLSSKYNRLNMLLTQLNI